MKIDGGVEVNNCTLRPNNVIVWSTSSNLGSYDTGGTIAMLSIQLNATGPTTVVFAKISGTLPSGISLSSSGLLSGNTTQTGSYSFSVQATAGAAISDRTFSLTIINSAAGNIGN